MFLSHANRDESIFVIHSLLRRRLVMEKEKKKSSASMKGAEQWCVSVIRPRSQVEPSLPFTPLI